MDLKKLFFVLLLCLAPSLPASSQVCKANQYDLLEWMNPWQGITNGHADVLFPTTGTFYWVKSANGYPWDVDTFDQDYIYQSITEWNWNDPNTYKNFEKPMPWLPRCVDIPQTPGEKITTIVVPPAQTTFDIHSSCTSFVRRNLGYAVNEIWGPYQETIGGTLPTNAETLVFSYRYDCNSNQSVCNDKETFALQQGSGLVQWTHYTWDAKSNAWNKVNQTTQANPEPATVTPVHPCW